METLLTGISAIILGVGATAFYFFGTNILIDKIFADVRPSFSAADFLALVSAVILLVSFLTMPWVAGTEFVTTRNQTVENATVFTGSSLVSADLGRASTAASTAKTAVLLIPLAAVIGIAFALWGLFEAQARGTSAVGTLLVGFTALGYYGVSYAIGGQIESGPGLSQAAGVGFWVALIAAVGLTLQVVIPRPVYTPPPSQVAMKVNTDTRAAVRPWMFIAPALLALTFYLIYPAFDTLRRSFFDARTDNFIGLDNYIWAFTNDTLREAFRNNILWLIIVPFFSVAFGLIVAVLADRVRFESIAKSLIFMPMAISFVGASVVWRFVYAFAPPGRPQIGLLNAVWTSFGGAPKGWFIDVPRPFNGIFLMLILIWIQAGFAMVLLSAALKAVPEETIEAARIDGANDAQIFFRVVLPQIMGTIFVVFTTIVIIVLKIFDIVFVMTSGQFGTEVLANRMFREMFRFINFGRGSTIAVILMLAVIPVMYINIRRFRREELMR